MAAAYRHSPSLVQASADDLLTCFGRECRDASLEAKPVAILASITTLILAYFVVQLKVIQTSFLTRYLSTPGAATFGPSVRSFSFREGSSFPVQIRAVT